MRAWYIPSHTGDFRLEKHPDNDGHCLLTVEDPTPGEIAKLGSFLATGRQRRWVDKALGISPTGRTELVVQAPLTKAGPVLAGDTMPGRGVLTVVKSNQGTLMCVADETQGTELAAALNEPKAKEPETPRLEPPPKPAAATTMRRPTTCCPHPLPVEGPLKRASRVLREFSTPSQWRSWVENGFLYCIGGLTGHRYRICHRNHPLAAAQGKIARDIDNGVTIHCWDWSVPPAEEVLAVKLILETREPWLRNQATYFGEGEVFDNPLGNGADGTWDAGFYRRIGVMIGAREEFFRDPITGVYEAI